MFGQRLRELRNKKGISQSDLGKLLNLTKSNISKYENNDLEPNLETIQFLADYFDCTIDYLLGKSDTQENNTKISHNLECTKTVKQFQKINQEAMQKALEPLRLAQEALAKAFKPLQQFNQTTDTSPPIPPAPTITPEEQLLIDKLRKLDPNNINIIMHTIDMFVEATVKASDVLDSENKKKLDEMKCEAIVRSDVLEDGKLPKDKAEQLLEIAEKLKGGEEK